MEIKVNDNNIKLHFGLDFIESLDQRIAEVLGTTVNDISYGQGLATYVQLFLGDDYRALSYILYDATCTMEEGRPTLKDIKEYMESVDIDALKNEVLEELKKSAVCAKWTNLGIQLSQGQSQETENRQGKRTKKQS